MKGSVLVALLGTSCFHPDPHEGLPCTAETQDCPEPLMCDHGVCLAGPQPDAFIDPACVCAGSTLSCPDGDTVCALGCLASGPHCASLVPSNSIDPALIAGTADILLVDVVVDTDTGEVSGGLSRPAGIGVIAGIGYYQQASSSGGPDLGIFTVGALEVPAGAKVEVRGTRAAVVLAGGGVTIAGTIDVSADPMAPSTAGPGGGAGGTAMTMATGCGGGGGGTKLSTGDSGGGGGAGGGDGGAGGASTSPVILGGAAGPACIDALLVPLAGGSGGGPGSPGITMIAAAGAGGGGALQITSLIKIDVDGSIIAAGGGGDGGPANATDAGSGAGGGGGGGILLEAPVVTLSPTTILAANGGGGGGAGFGTAGMPGEPGGASAVPAPGGISGGAVNARGGNGGAGSIAATAGGPNTNGGGGGGGTGVIAIHAGSFIPGGITSPTPASTGVVLQ